MPEQRATAILDRCWNGCVPVNLGVIAASLGVAIELEPMGEASGEVRLENGRPIIKVNAADALVRQRFTVAHELGHYALGHLRENGQRMFRDSRSDYSMAASWHEREANRFAAALLMPADAIRFIIQSGHATTLDALAKQFGVSNAAMQFRVRKLGIFEHL